MVNKTKSQYKCPSCNGSGYLSDRDYAKARQNKVTLKRCKRVKCQNVINGSPAQIKRKDYCSPKCVGRAMWEKKGYVYED